MLFDTHAHLNDEAFENDQDLVIQDFYKSGVTTVVNPAIDMPTSYSAVELAHKYPFVYAAVGYHPHEAKKYKEEDYDKLIELSKDEKVVAIGEIGLDYHYMLSEKETQKEVFIKHIQLANQLDMPFIIHSREASKDTYDIVKQYNKNSNFVLHCFSQSLEMAKLYMDMPCYLSFGGSMTFKNAAKLREVVAYVPLDRIFIETDSPYLTPVPFRGKRNDPSKVRLVAAEMAKVKNLPIETIIEETEKNAKKFFNIK